MHSAFRVMRGDPEIVRVRFKPHVAHVVRERIWHPSQEGRDDADGCVVVTLQVPINYEVLSWILGYGPAAKVLEPPSLAELVRKELGECLEQTTVTNQIETPVLEKKNRPKCPYLTQTSLNVGADSEKGIYHEWKSSRVLFTISRWARNSVTEI